jgi:hypothetical protein
MLGDGEDISVTERLAELTEQVALLTERLDTLEQNAVTGEDVQALIEQKLSDDDNH